MRLVVRYASLLGLGLASLLAVVRLGTDSGQALAAGGPTAAAPREMALWVVAVIVALSLLSLVRFVLRLPALAREWLAGHKDKLATLAMIAIVGVVFVVL